MKVAIIIGHDEKSQGAVTYNKITEYQFNKYIAETIKELHAFKITHKIHKFLALHVFDRNQGWQSVANQLKANDIDLSIELHLNSYHQAASGTETLYLENDFLSKDFAKNLSFRIAKHFNSKLRGEEGTVDISDGDRGYSNLNYAKKGGVKIAVLVEPGFVNFLTSESVALINNPLEYANIIYKTLENYVTIGDTSNGVNTVLA